jgi:hypothetical protein
MGTKVIAVLIAVGLAIGVWWLWPRGESADPVATTVLAAEPTTTATDVFTSTTPTSTTLANSESHVVETVEEAEEILRELWFGWFEGIYNQDEDRIREVVATEEFLNAGIEAFEALEFTSPPTREAISFDDTELLEATAECIAIWTTGTVEFLGTNRENTGVDVLRRTNNTWQILSTWLYKDDLWQADCESRL